MWNHKRNHMHQIKSKDERLNHLTNEKSSQIMKLCKSITVPTSVPVLHPVVKSLYSKVNRKDETTNRIIKIKDTIYKAFTELGYKVTDGDKFIVDNEIIGFSLIQQKKQIPHEYTEDELRRKERYGYTYAPKYDYKETDKLTLRIDEQDAKRKNWNDTEKKKIEQAIGDFIIEVIVTAEYKRIARQMREAQHRKWDEENKRREHLRHLRSNDTKKFEDLERKATDYKTSMLIMEYVNALECKLNADLDAHEKERIRRYIEWAKGKADWLNPLINKEDPLFGTRHEKLYLDFNDDDEYCSFIKINRLYNDEEV